jgi:aspartate/methionine/tyrosine aminotransferase
MRSARSTTAAWCSCRACSPRSASTARCHRGAFYLWAPAPGGDAWALARRLATEAGAIVSPGEFYGPAGAGHVRIAVVQPDERLTLVAQRLGVDGAAVADGAVRSA